MCWHSSSMSGKTIERAALAHPHTTRVRTHHPRPHTPPALASSTAATVVCAAKGEGCAPGRVRGACCADVLTQSAACYSAPMTVEMSTPTVSELPAVIDLISAWQVEGAPIQVHPGDLGWYERFGPEALAAVLRVWSREGEPLALGFLDESELIRMALAPTAADDHDLARVLVDDFAEALDEVLPAGSGIVEARFGDSLRRELSERGWQVDEPWTPLRRDLSEPVESVPLEIAVVGSDHLADRVAVEQSAFGSDSFTAESWHRMAAGHAYRHAQCLVGYNRAGDAVATATVWSAGHDRPGIIEPLGVHRDHQRHGYGVAMTLAAAEAMRSLGCSSATVATPSSNTAAVAAYSAAGFSTEGEVTDFRRPGPTP